MVRMHTLRVSRCVGHGNASPVVLRAVRKEGSRDGGSEVEEKQ